MGGEPGGGRNPTMPILRAGGGEVGGCGAEKVETGSSDGGGEDGPGGGGPAWETWTVIGGG